MAVLGKTTNLDSGELETNSLIQESMAKLYGLCQKRIAELDREQSQEEIRKADV